MREDIYLVDDRLNLVTEDEIDAAEDRLGINLPQGYRNFLLQFGKGTLCGLIDIPSPDKIIQVSLNCRWARGRNILDEAEIIASFEIASTIDADSIIYCPGSERDIYILPRHDDTIYWIDKCFSDPTIWYSDVGVVREKEPFKYFESLVDRSCIEVIFPDDHLASQKVVSSIKATFEESGSVLHRAYKECQLIFVRELSAIIEVGQARNYIRFDFNPMNESRILSLISSLESEGMFSGCKLIFHM
ncbi:hypothetical protein EUZ85_14240 [Hahella sp. KA22]|uniref:SMI1/KNR4 family protein n=1 Tax=Hahella sp. KA22 TaxID=1628392 RepID=UPI000FDF5133|nr:SMI1/KNR4 family protein [Hahella sp. KA22]AZZ91826.1 hypothetical protein ENC22_11680 [Hahella sp. KA22]QAY55196.1 hypothetical protein EUZ85_14240 [Hahella sp. KA22]